MARRPNLARVDLTEAGQTPAAKTGEKGREGMRAQTLRLPSDYWHKLRVLAALRQTTMVQLVQLGLDEMFKKLTKQERDTLDML